MLSLTAFTISMGVVAVLLPLTLSPVAPVVAVTVTGPVAGAVKLTEQLMVPPTETVMGGVGAQLTEAPDGRPVTAQVAAGAERVPTFVQVAVPATGLPATTPLGNPFKEALIST
jgi:hypothetical protein